MRDGHRNGGWFTTLMALVALVVVGFFCGALAGFLWEEPGLVLAYLAGETEEAEWSEPAPVAAEPPLLAEALEPPPMRAAPEPEPEPEPVAAKAEPVPDPPAAKPAPAPAPAPKPVAAVPKGRFAVQVGAFAESEPAEKLAARLRASGYSAYVRTSTEAGTSRWRVRVGPVPARSEAEELAAKLEKGEKLPTWVLDEDRS